MASDLMGSDLNCKTCGDGCDVSPHDQLCSECREEETLTPKSIFLALSQHQIIESQAEAISYKMFGHYPEEIEWPSALGDPEAQVEVKWEERACSCGCCGYETFYKSFPLRLLWTKDWETGIESIQQAEKEAKEAKEAAEKKATAKAKLERAKATAATAQANADAALRKAEDELAEAGGMVSTT